MSSHLTYLGADDHAGPSAGAEAVRVHRVVAGFGGLSAGQGPAGRIDGTGWPWRVAVAARMR